MFDSKFPVVVPEPGSLYGFEIEGWYSDALGKIRHLVSGVEPSSEVLEFVWTLKSQVRFAAAMGLIDQEAAVEFLKNHPLPALEMLYPKVGESETVGACQAALDMLLMGPNGGVDGSNISVVNGYLPYQETIIANNQLCPQLVSNVEEKGAGLILPPRPIVPNPEYLGTDWKPFYSQASEWKDAPSICYAESLENRPCLLVCEDNLWLSYLSGGGQVYAVVRFGLYIEHQETRIGDNLKAHPYWVAGLQERVFNVLSFSALTKYWSRFQGKHWVVNFADRTIDILAQEVHVVARAVSAASSLEALKAVIDVAAAG